MKLFACFAGFVLAFLVSNRAGSFACRLAWSLALTAAAFCTGFFKICAVNSFDMFHYVILQNSISFLIKKLYHIVLLLATVLLFIFMLFFYFGSKSEANMFFYKIFLNFFQKKCCIFAILGSIYMEAFLSS